MCYTAYSQPCPFSGPHHLLWNTGDLSLILSPASATVGDAAHRAGTHLWMGGKGHGDHGRLRAKTNQGAHKQNHQFISVVALGPSLGQSEDVASVSWVRPKVSLQERCSGPGDTSGQSGLGGPGYSFRVQLGRAQQVGAAPGWVSLWPEQGWPSAGPAAPASHQAESTAPSQPLHSGL